ncbi:MAG: class I SAM-dependent methyltransferase [Oscillospiraceae bacterium]|nr:class I SAM-dependent methyltransferase [Oscillospiraceae bacterium]
MAGYGEFAGVYDLLTENVPYDEIAAYYNSIITELGGGKRLLDMGCGTGSLTIRLADMGYEVVGADASADMLSVAARKSDKVRWICQSMTETELYTAAETAVSTLDSVNHLSDKGEISVCFQRLAENLTAGGLFVFDVNTVCKHREILGNNTFVYDIDGVYCAWNNTFRPEDNGVDIELDLFYENEDGSYSRGYESFGEIALTVGELTELLEDAGFEVVKIYDYLTFDPPRDDSEKLLIAARKIN